MESEQDWYDSKSRGGYIANLKFVGSIYETNTTHKMGIAITRVNGEKRWVLAWDTGYWHDPAFNTMEAAETALKSCAEGREQRWRKKL